MQSCTHCRMLHLLDAPHHHQQLRQRLEAPCVDADQRGRSILPSAQRINHGLHGIEIAADGNMLTGTRNAHVSNLTRICIGEFVTIDEQLETLTDARLQHTSEHMHTAATQTARKQPVRCATRPLNSELSNIYWTSRTRSGSDFASGLMHSG